MNIENNYNMLGSLNSSKVIENYNKLIGIYGLIVKILLKFIKKHTQFLYIGGVR